MEITNNTTSGIYTNEYKSKNMIKQASYEDTVNSKASKTTGKTLGMGFTHDKNSPVSYGMVAKYAENSTENNPIIKVSVRSEEYYININEVNPKNASEIEMFALCCYADDKGIGTGGTFGSWQTLNYYKDNAAHNGYFEMPDGMDSFQSVKQDWMKMVQLMMKDYMEAGVFKQALDGKGLLGIFERYGSMGS